MNWELIEFVALRIAGLLLALLIILALLPSTIHQTLSRRMGFFVNVTGREVRPMMVSALYFFFALAAYFILRPIRDEMAVAGGTRELPLLWLGTLAAMLVANPIYSAMVAKYPVKKFVTFAYMFFALGLIVFYQLWQSQSGLVLTGRVFFVFTSVFALFVTSVFWGVMADRFSNAQAKRLFGFIGLGGTLGSITGSALTAYLSERVGVPAMLLISALFVFIAIALVLSLPSAVESGDRAQAAEKVDDPVIGGSAFAGMFNVMKSPYMGTIALFLFLYVFGSTIVYTAQTEIIGQVFSDRAERTAVLARIELVVQSLAAIGQVLFTARAIKYLGLRFTLSAVPVVSLLGFAALGLAGAGLLPLLGTYVVFAVLRRSTEFAFTNPSRKVLFTVMSREDKYKSTNFLETFVYRAGDQLSIVIIAALMYFGLSLSIVSFMAVPIMLIFVGAAIWLARRQGELAAAKERSESLPQPAAAPAIAPSTP